MGTKRNKPVWEGGIIGEKPEYTGRQQEADAFANTLQSLERRLSMQNVGMSLNDMMRGQTRLMEAYMNAPRWRSRPEPQRVTAAQIHAELYAGVDTDLLEPEPMTLAQTPATERVNTLRAMGFSEQPDVQAWEQENRAYTEQHQDWQRRQQLHDLARRYALRYPACKFISAESLSRVIKKYGLIVQRTKRFIGTIPDANVQEMARFHEQVTLHEEDRDANSEDYCIAAPVDQFKPDFYGFATREEYQRWLIEDPIVLKSVQGGWLIVTCWGDEARDPDVLNERNN